MSTTAQAEPVTVSPKALWDDIRKEFTSELIDQIKKAHDAATLAIGDGVRSALVHAKEAGTKLTYIRDQIKAYNKQVPKNDRKTFKGWFQKQSFKFTPRTASNYMRISDQWDTLERDQVGERTVRAALSTIRTKEGKGKAKGDGEGEGKVRVLKRKVKTDDVKAMLAKYNVKIPDAKLETFVSELARVMGLKAQFSVE